MNNDIKFNIYLDYASTTPCAPQVVSVVSELLVKQLGHPYADHVKGEEALTALNQAEDNIKSYVCGDHLIWTSGATESNNTALICTCCCSDRKSIIVTCDTEHKSILEPCLISRQGGIDVFYLPVDSEGHIIWSKLQYICDFNPYMLSMMMINNETGVRHPIGEIGQLCQSKGILFHVDSAQAFGKVPIDMKAMGIDLLTISGHKIYGPPGIGALVTSEQGLKRLQGKGLMFGGKPPHQHNIRPGTPPVALCVGFAKAAELAYADMQSEYDRLRVLKDYCWQTLKANIPNILMNGADDTPFILNVRFPREKDKDPLKGLNEQLTFSTAAACNCGGVGHVMVAMGIRPEDFHILRLSFGRYTTHADVEEATRLIIERLKSS